MALEVKTIDQPSVFEYLDYRIFLNDFYVYKKEEDSTFSYRSWGKRSKLSPSLLKMVLTGARNLSIDQASGLAYSLKLSRQEGEYFSALVAWNQAKQNVERDEAWGRLIKAAPLQELHHLTRGQNSLLRSWVGLAIFEYLRMNGAVWSLSEIRKHLNFDPPREEVVHAMHTLEENGFVKKNANDHWEQTKKALFAGGPIPSDLIKNYHHQACNLGLKALFELEISLREFAAATIAVDDAGLELLKEKFKAFHREIIKMGAQTNRGRHLIQLNMQLFPLTKNTGIE